MLWVPMVHNARAGFSTTQVSARPVARWLVRSRHQPAKGCVLDSLQGFRHHNCKERANMGASSPRHRARACQACHQALERCVFADDLRSEFLPHPVPLPGPATGNPRAQAAHTRNRISARWLPFSYLGSSTYVSGLALCPIRSQCAVLLHKAKRYATRVCCLRISLDSP
jgi:hypothetical protein